ncbi:hypothetical protein PG996_000170 [Apiospora saccharicola]|uniref:Uncharacterized protein n=1 Tax=Apiospora saccharicola TaxID=335842 RepID=A0ABR1WD01_9PEZI
MAEERGQQEKDMAAFKRWQYLSPIDCFIPPQYVRQFLCFPTSGPSSILALKEGLEKTISLIPQLSSSLVPSSSLCHSVTPPSSCRLNRFVLGSPRRHGIADVFSEGPADLVRDWKYTSLRRAGFPNNLLSRDAFLPPLPHFPAVDEPAPAFRVRATQIPGGTVVCVCWHHGLADLGGMDSVMKTWSYFCQQRYSEGEPGQTRASSAAASLNRPMVECDRRAVFAPILDNSTGTTNDPVPPADIHVLDTIPPVLTPGLMAQLPLETAHFRIPIGVVQDLKTRVQKHLPAEVRLSTNDLICAMMWSATTSAMANLSPTQNAAVAGSRLDDEVSMGLSVDMRQRLGPHIPDSFIGNALAMAWPTVSRRVLLSAAQAAPGDDQSSSSFPSLAEVASHIRLSHEALNEGYFRDLVAYLGCHNGDKDTRKLQWGPGPSQTNMVAATWRGLQLDSVDWGAEVGQCEAVRTRLPFPHTITILPRTVGSQSVDVAYCLLAPTMQRLKSCRVIQEYWEELKDDETRAEGQESTS